MRISLFSTLPPCVLHAASPTHTQTARSREHRAGPDGFVVECLVCPRVDEHLRHKSFNERVPS